MNSEVYNHESIKKSCPDVSDLGTTCDSTVIGQLYLQYGKTKSYKEIVDHLDGKFSLILFDEKNQFSMIARDPIGLCPLYWGRNQDGTIYAASELKALEGLCTDYQIFPPGHVWTSTQGLQRWYEPSWLTEIPSQQSYQDVLPRIRQALTNATQKRLMSDVPVAFLLSGGLDSSIICSIVRRLCPNRELHTFSVGIEGSPDLLAAQAVAKHLKSIHHEIHFTVEEALDATPNTIYHIESFEQVRASVPMMILMKKIRELGFKVILSGEGSDEIFGGYLYFYYAPNREEYQRELVRKVQKLN